MLLCSHVHAMSYLVGMVVMSSYQCEWMTKLSRVVTLSYNCSIPFETYQGSITH